MFGRDEKKEIDRAGQGVVGYRKIPITTELDSQEQTEDSEVHTFSLDLTLIRFLIEKQKKQKNKNGQDRES